MSTHDRRQRVEDAWAALLATGQPVAFDQVATRAGIGRATLYRNPDLRAIVEEHRARGREAHTLTGLSTEIATCASPSTPSPPPSAATNNNSADYAVTTSAPTAEFLRHPTPPKRPGLAG